jgi:hypothetical protein
LICLYGYSLFCFLPAVLLCIFPVSLLQWLCLLYALANSTNFLRANLLKYTQGLSEIVLVSIIAATQFILILCLKLIFLSLLEPK